MDDVGLITCRSSKPTDVLMFYQENAGHHNRHVHTITVEQP